jgi:hypothetical protein
LVADQLAAAVGEDRRAFNKALTHRLSTSAPPDLIQTHIHSAFVAFYQIDSSLRKWKSGVKWYR